MGIFMGVLADTVNRTRLITAGELSMTDRAARWTSVEDDAPKDILTQAGVYRSGERLVAVNRPESEDEPDEGYYWEEGKWEPTANISSIADCTAMKNDGVKIYTIGFALSEGWYDTNGYFGYPTDDYIDSDVRNQAYSFLASCASEPETFLTAENADELEEAFSRIGAEIQTEIIRLSN